MHILLKNQTHENQLMFYYQQIYHNLTYNDILKHEINNYEGISVKTDYGDTFLVNTGKYTGRSPKDKWIVKNNYSKDIWWGDINQPITKEVFNDIYNTAINHFNNLNKYYVYDGYCGYSSSKKHIRFIHELSWQQHFVKNMFIEPQNNIEVYDNF